jgi:transposase
MPVSLPIELRARVVNAFNEGSGTLSDLAKRFSVSVSSVFRWIKLDEHYSDLSPKPHGGHREHKIPDEDLEKLKALVFEKPDRTVKELAAEWNARYSGSVGNAVMGRALLRAGLPFKKRLFER